MITVAFYQAPGDWLDKLIRQATDSPYSHCELVMGPLEIGQTARAISSSYRDGGVRIKEITFDAGKWFLVPVPWAGPSAFDRAARHIGARYDTIGAVLTQFPTLRAQSDARWFCSELTAFALGLFKPETLSPGALALYLANMKFAYGQGRLAS